MYLSLDVRLEKIAKELNVYIFFSLFIKRACKYLENEE